MYLVTWTYHIPHYDSNTYLIPQTRLHHKLVGCKCPSLLRDFAVRTVVTQVSVALLNSPVIQYNLKGRGS